MGERLLGPKSFCLKARWKPVDLMHAIRWVNKFHGCKAYPWMSALMVGHCFTRLIAKFVDECNASSVLSVSSRSLSTNGMHHLDSCHLVVVSKFQLDAMIMKSWILGQRQGFTFSKPLPGFRHRFLLQIIRQLKYSGIFSFLSSVLYILHISICFWGGANDFV